MKEVSIIGVGSYVPDNIVTNDDLAKIVDTSDDWISSRTGIKERRISTGETTVDLAVKAACKAIEDANITPDQIDLIVLGTITADYFCPSTACLVQEKIGALNATCFDINAACSGYLYSMNIAAQFIKSGQSKTALIIGVDILSKVLDWTDRTTCVLFGDGASAAVLSASNNKGIYSIYTGSDGSKGMSLVIPSLPVKNFGENTPNDFNNFIKMQGADVFKFATSAISNSIDKALESSNVSLDEISYIICHQANYRIIEYASKKTNISIDKFFINLHKYGNTSAASIGIALDELYRQNGLKKGDKIILVGFGGGFTWGSVLVEWTKN